ncbi:hypothetical protein [Vibrio sp. HN007]|uniref:hypothetical protein n=1 Tax=Vibrio iocasae TaxID=3098914 RepID=UPI0035D427EE
MIRKLLSFVLLANMAIVGTLYLTDLFFGWIKAQYVSDYFFYSFLLHIILAAFVAVSPPPKLRYLKHSPSKETKVAASMIQQSTESEQEHFSSADLSLGLKLLLSGLTSFVICLCL